MNLALSICLQNHNRSIMWYYKWLNYYISHFQMIQHWQVTSIYFRCYRLFHLDLLVQNHQAYLTWFCQKEQWALERESVEKTGASTIGWEVTLRPFAPEARARPVRPKWAQPTGQGCRTECGSSPLTMCFVYVCLCMVYFQMMAALSCIKITPKDP